MSALAVCDDEVFFSCRHSPCQMSSTSAIDPSSDNLVNNLTFLGLRWEQNRLLGEYHLVWIFPPLSQTHACGYYLVAWQPEAGLTEKGPISDGSKDYAGMS